LRNEVGSTWALTSLMSGGLAAWLVVAVLSGEPEAQAEMTTVAIGGRRGRRHLEALLVGCVAALLTVAFIVYPLVLMKLFGRPVFNRSVGGSDLVAATVAHIGCAVLGGSIGVLFAPPRVKRRATAFAGITATLVVLASASPPNNLSAGPIALARVLEKAHGQVVTGALLLSSATCVLLGAAILSVAEVWTRRVA
jgi:hypothetical protein